MQLRRMLAYAAIYFLWGGTYLAVRAVVLITPPFSAAALRFLLSGILLLGMSRLRGPGAAREPWPTGREWANSAKLGFVMFTINYATFFWAEQRLYSGVAAVVVSTMPVWIMMAERLIGGIRRLPAWSLAGSALGIVGVVLVTRGNAGSAPSSSQNTTAIVMLLAGTLCWSFGSVWSRDLQLPASQSTRAALQMTTGGVGLAVLALLAGEAPRVATSILQWAWITWLCFTYLIVASIVAFTAYVWLLNREPANRVASYAYVNPVVALTLGVFLAHERIGRWQVFGAGFVLLGVFATLRGRSAGAFSKISVRETTTSA